MGDSQLFLFAAEPLVLFFCVVQQLHFEEVVSPEGLFFGLIFEAAVDAVDDQRDGAGEERDDDDDEDEHPEVGDVVVDCEGVEEVEFEGGSCSERTLLRKERSTGVSERRSWSASKALIS